jgi:saccharopine dehydrogenase-like NADP-dependent oxidoreductase
LKKNILIIGAGGVAHVAAHKCAQYNDILGDICIASRTQSKCDKIIESIHRKNNIKDKNKRLYSRQINALDTQKVIELIKETNSSIVINLGTAFLNMSVLNACIETKVDYIDTAIYEDPTKVCENPPWYNNYEWKKKDLCKKAKINAILGIGFDPGVVNAYVNYTKKYYLDSIDTIDIVDINAGNHGKYFATNFDPEINFREFIKVWTYIDKKWRCFPVHSIKRDINVPELGCFKIYLNGHDEIHSLSENIKANSIRFWMSFSDHYINVFTVLKNIGLISHLPVEVEGQKVIPLKVLKALLPDPLSLAPAYKGKTFIGDFIFGRKNKEYKGFLLYNICDHEKCYNEVESQAISYTAGVPAAVAAILLSMEKWNPQRMVNVEELDSEPFLKLLDEMNLKTNIIELNNNEISNFKKIFTLMDSEMRNIYI